MHAISGYIVRLNDCDDDRVVPIAKGYGMLESKPVGIDYVYIETDYFGGCGEQLAYAFIANRKIKAKSKYGPINEMLKLLGVEKEVDKDEFDTVNLGNYRSNDDLFG